MKKIMVIGLVLLLSVAMLAGCGKSDTKTGDPTPGEETQEPTPAPTPEPTPTPEPEPTPESEPVITGEEVTIERLDAILTIIVPEGWVYKVWNEGSRINLYHHEPPLKDSYPVNAAMFGVSLGFASDNPGYSPNEEEGRFSIDNRIIAGADCEGLFYTSGAGDSFQYGGKLDDKYGIYVFGEGFDTDDPEINAIIDNITFTVN